MQVHYFPRDLKVKLEEPFHIQYYENLQSRSQQKVSFDYHAISLLQEGQKEVFSPHHREKIQSPQALLFRAGNCLMTERLSEGGLYRSILLFFKGEVLLDCASKLSQLSKANPREADRPFWIIEGDAFMQHFSQSLGLIQDYPSMQKAKIEEFLIYLLEKYGQSLLDFFQRPGANVSLRKVVESHLLNPVSVEELAFLCHMSLSTFKREFYKNYQATPSRWMKIRRLELARKALQSGDLRPSDIYLQYGFGSLSRFIQAFKAEFGITPKQFQQSLD